MRTIFLIIDQGTPRRVKLKVTIPVNINRLIVIVLSQTAASSLNQELVDHICDVAGKEKNHFGEEQNNLLDDQGNYEDQVQGLDYKGTDLIEVKLVQK